MDSSKRTKRRCKLIGTAVVICALIGCFFVLYKIMEKGRYKMEDIQLMIQGTDKARYEPKDEIVINASLANLTKNRTEGIILDMQVYHLEQVVYSDQQEITLEAEESKALSFNWQAPGKDYQGYLVCLTIKDAGNHVIVSDSIGVDISSDWVKYPRYGYLCDYEEDKDTEAVIEKMNRYHINAIEYYDWHALHHEPIPPESTKENPGVWKDWAGHEINGETLKRYLHNAHERNMVNMSYNMIYAGTDSFVKDSEGNPTNATDWQIHFAPGNEEGEGPFTFTMGVSPSGNGNLYFMNPLNHEWQEYIFTQQKRVFETLDFDGWHGDTVGDWGKMTDALGNPLGYDEQGNPIDVVKDTYREFLNAAKEALGEHYLSFNPVGAQGIAQVNTSDSDVLYTEFWPWDMDREGVQYNTYQSLVTEVERSMEESKPYSIDGKGKSLVVKAYINYYKTNGTMNDPGVLLCDAAIYAAGGSRLELGNGENMLHVEYYPDDDIPMSEELRDSMIQMADFTVAYENLLRDGQYTTENEVKIEDYSVSRNGQEDTIWAYTRADEKYEILHLINLLGTDNEWRDERGKKETPEFVKDLHVRYYTNKDIAQVNLASFSIEEGVSQELPFKNGEDANGKFIEFNLAELEYWNVVYMK